MDGLVDGVCAAILQFNNPNIRKTELYKKLCFPALSERAIEMLKFKFYLSSKKSSERRTEEYKRAEAIRRQKKRSLIALATAGKYLYKGKEQKVQEFLEIEQNIEIQIILQSFWRNTIETPMPIGFKLELKKPE